jgi:predicted nucleic acid-binding protein
VSTLLLDASVILAAFDSDDELHGPSQTLLADPGVTLATLDLARYEVANVAVRGWGELGRVVPLLEAIDRISGDGGVIPSTTILLSRAAELAEEHTISVYDAAYVAAADQAGGTLISCDIRGVVSRGLASSPATSLAGGQPRSSGESSPSRSGRS